jgi:hypothetical protein
VAKDHNIVHFHRRSSIDPREEQPQTYVLFSNLALVHIHDWTQPAIVRDGNSATVPYIRTRLSQVAVLYADGLL